MQSKTGSAQTVNDSHFAARKWRALRLLSMYRLQRTAQRLPWRAMVHSTLICGADTASDLNDLNGSEAGSAPELSTATLSSGARTRYLIQISRLSGHAASESRSENGD
jgi:hypothetical protein